MWVFALQQSAITDALLERRQLVSLALWRQHSSCHAAAVLAWTLCVPACLPVCVCMTFCCVLDYLKHLPNVETRFYCPQAFLSLDVQCRHDVLN